MHKVVFNKARMQKAELDRARMQEASLRFANMEGVELLETQMQGATLNGAQIGQVDITDSLMKGISVTGVDFTEAKYEPEELQAQLQEMFGHREHTILPDGINPPGRWSEADMNTQEGEEQYQREWEAFKKEIGVV